MCTPITSRHGLDRYEHMHTDRPRCVKTSTAVGRTRHGLISLSIVIVGLVYLKGWLGNRVVSVLDPGAEGPRFKSQPLRCRVTVLGKLFTPIVPLFIK